jgi:hypothetical protein
MSALAELSKLFVHQFRTDARRMICDAMTTNSTRTRVGVLHTLVRRGWITYESNESMERLWGAKFWDVKLTSKGRAELERVVAQHAAVTS